MTPSADNLLPFAIGLLLGGVVVAILLFRRRRGIAAHATTTSRAVLKGQLAEQLAPLTSGFRYATKDARFLGSPIDYVVFRGLSVEGADIEIVLVEVKSGKARLSRNEQRVSEAVRLGRVRFEVVHIDE